jgi:hypothetical protein
MTAATPAQAATWTQPDLSALPGSLVKGSGAWLELPWTIVWKLEGLAVGSGPRAVTRSADGGMLVVSRGNGLVYEIAPDGTRTGWEYPGVSPSYAARLATGDVLVVEPDTGSVIALSDAVPPTEVWRVDMPAGSVPVHAVELPAGNTLGVADLLVADRAGRVAAVRRSDGAVVWQYGSPDDGWPAHVEYLANGNVLITYDLNRTKLDAEGVVQGNMVREVRPDGTVAWQYGTNGTMGAGPNQLAGPTWAERLPDGTTMITDSGNNRVIRVNAERAIVWQYSAASLLGLSDGGVSAPGGAVVTSTGSVLIADTNNDRLIELGRAGSGMVTSPQIDCGLPGVRKRFGSVLVRVDAPAGTSYAVAYSVDGGPWKAVSGSTLPSNTFGKLIRYRITLATTRRDVTPRLLSVSIGYVVAPASGAGRPSANTSNWNRYWPGSTPGSGGQGVKQGGVGFTSAGGSATGGPLAGPLSVQRGWAMVSAGPALVIGGAPDRAGSPEPSYGGLIVLGALYAAGAVSVPLGQLAARLVGRVPHSV